MDLEHAASNTPTPAAAEKTPVGSDSPATPAVSGGDKPTLTHTQADLDRVAGEARRQERKKVQDEIEAARLLEEGKHKELAERTAKDLEATQAANRKLEVRLAAQEKAVELGITNLKRALQLIEPDLEYDEAGAPTNLEALLKAIVKEVPSLAGAAAAAVPAPSGAATNSARTPGLTLEAIKLMTPEQINARWDEVQRVLGK